MPLMNVAARRVANQPSPSASSGCIFSMPMITCVVLLKEVEAEADLLDAWVLSMHQVESLLLMILGRCACLPT